MLFRSVYFDDFDAQRDALTAAGVLIQKDTQPSTDFEPEYIAVNGRTAYVALQEANAIAVLDIDKAQFTGVYLLGLQDYSAVKADLEKNDKIELKNYENVYGIKMPDGIAVTTIGGKTYLLTANEGDSRADWAGMDNETESKTSPTGNVKLDSKVVWFNAAMWDGLDQSKAYVFGGRSFSIYEVTDTGLKQVYDSGSGIETVTAEKLADHFNCSNDKTGMDNRSGKKGPEPESVVTGTVNGKTYAFIGLERIGGGTGVRQLRVGRGQDADSVRSVDLALEQAYSGDPADESFVKGLDVGIDEDLFRLLVGICGKEGGVVVHPCESVDEDDLLGTHLSDRVEDEQGEIVGLFGFGGEFRGDDDDIPRLPAGCGSLDLHGLALFRCGLRAGLRRLLLLAFGLGKRTRIDPDRGIGVSAGDEGVLLDIFKGHSRHDIQFQFAGQVAREDGTHKSDARKTDDGDRVAKFLTFIPVESRLRHCVCYRISLYDCSQHTVS